MLVRTSAGLVQVAGLIALDLSWPSPHGEADRRVIENGLADLKEALKGSDADAITTKTNALAQASMKLGEAMYKQAAEQQADGGGAGGEGKKEDVVDAEFTEVDDDKKNKKSA